MRYLITGGTGIGDNIISLSMARAIRKNDPQAVIHAFSRSDKNRIKISGAILGVFPKVRK